MDKKAQAILKHYKNKIESRSFDEYDIIGFLIFFRSYINKGNYKTIYEFADLIAHRNRNRGRVMESIKNEIDNNYKFRCGSKKIKGYNGIHYDKWEKEWERLGKEFDIKFTAEIIRDLTICIFTIAQFTEYKKGKYSGRIEMIKSENALSLHTTESNAKSLYIVFFNLLLDPSKNIEDEKFYPVDVPIEAVRINGELKLKEVENQ